MTSTKPTCGVLAGEPVIIGERCADGGTCHHCCTAECFRRACCVPLTASGLNDDWSAPVEEPAPMLCPGCNQPMVDGQAFNGLYGCHWDCADKVREQERAQRPPRKPTELDKAVDDLRSTALEAIAAAEKLEAENYALQDQVKGLQELMAQQDAQLAERDALIIRVLGHLKAGKPGEAQVALYNALSASAEPSAPVRVFGMNLVVDGNMPGDEMHLVNHEGEPIKLVVADGKARDV